MFLADICHIILEILVDESSFDAFQQFCWIDRVKKIEAQKIPKEMPSKN